MFVNWMSWNSTDVLKLDALLKKYEQRLPGQLLVPCATVHIRALPSPWWTQSKGVHKQILRQPNSFLQLWNKWWNRLVKIKEGLKTHSEWWWAKSSFQIHMQVLCLISPLFLWVWLTHLQQWQTGRAWNAQLDTRGELTLNGTGLNSADVTQAKLLWTSVRVLSEWGLHGFTESYFLHSHQV